MKILKNLTKGKWLTKKCNDNNDIRYNVIFLVISYFILQMGMSTSA